MENFDLDRPLLEFVSSSEKSTWTIRHAVEGVQIFGGIGSGKTSGSGRMLALKYLAAGFGGLVLTVKLDEKQAWQEYCYLTGRIQDLVILEPGGSERFNFLEYESRHVGGKQTATDNIVEVLKTVIRAGDGKGSIGGDDPFWESALDMLMFNVIDLCQLAYGTLSIQQMYDIVQTIPQGKKAFKQQLLAERKSPFLKALEAAQERVKAKIDLWEVSLSEHAKKELEDADLLEQRILETLPEARLLKFLDQFFFENFIELSDRTRSIIDFSFAGFLFRLLREPVYSLFCKGTSTVIPEDSLQGKIILLSLPVKFYHKVGRDCQILFKYIWQRAMERRDVAKNQRPLFLWADEAQNFLHEHDADYQATARSSRVATVYISQNMPNYYACMGGQKANFRVKSFLGTLATKIFHANADSDTNQYASELVGDDFFEEKSTGTTVSKDFSQTRNLSLKLDRVIRPEEFARLKTGGPHNGQRVEGYLHRQGDTVFKGQNHTKMVFDQNYQPPKS